jgi:nitric oxide reductase large subunit
MVWLIWIGAALTALGLAGLAWMILAALRLRRAGLPPEALRAALQRLVAVNLGAVGIAAIGLMMVVLGVILG